MTRDETNKVFALLREYYPNARQVKDKAAIAAWRLVLENFPYADVKAKIIRHAATHRYFPDVYDITGSLTPEPGAFPAQQNAPVCDRMARDARRLRELAKKGDGGP